MIATQTLTEIGVGLFSWIDYIGTIQVITEDRNGNPMQGLLASRDSVSNKTTNSAGVAEYSLGKTCGDSMEFRVYCTNSSSATLCGTQTARLDVVNDYEGLLFDCSICSGIPDIQINVDNVRVNKANNNVTINISIASSFTATDVNITFKVQGKDGLISQESSQLFSINSESFKSLNQTIAFTNNDEFLHVYSDARDKVAESNEKNNYALVPLVQPTVYAYFSINTGYTSIDNEIKDYLKLYVNEVSSQDKANVTIAVGLPKKNSIIESENWFTYKNYHWYIGNVIYYNNKALGSKPYNGIVGGFKDDYNYIFVAGNDIDGLLAAVKRLVSARSLFFANFDKNRVSVIEDTDIAGISVADLLRNPSNLPYYTQRGSDAFANVVERILNNNNFEIAIKTVQTLNTTSYNQSTILRLKNVNSDFSQNYKDVISSGGKPVVMSGGIFSTLTTWEDNGKGLARDLVNDGHDVWEIEMNGGDNTECSTCPDYTYQDQVDYYWPVLMAGVMNYSGKTQAHYIGHSNGCRVALSSLNSYSNGKNGSGFAFNTQTGLYDLNISLLNKSVDKFFGVACPATLNDDTAFTLVSRSTPLQLPQSQVSSGDLAIGILREDQFKHVRMFDYSLWLAIFRKDMLVDIVTVFSLFFDEKISLNLMDFYNDLAVNTSSYLNLSNMNVSKLYLYNANPNDLIVGYLDQDRVFGASSISEQNRNGSSLNGKFVYNHVIIKSREDVKEDIKRRLKQ